MKFWQDKEKMILVSIVVLGLVFLLGVFIGRISAHNIYYIPVSS